MEVAWLTSDNSTLRRIRGWIWCYDALEQGIFALEQRPVAHYELGELSGAVVAFKNWLGEGSPESGAD